MKRTFNKITRSVALVLAAGLFGVGCKDDSPKTPPPAPSTPVVPAPGTPPTPKASAGVSGAPGNASTPSLDTATGAAATATLTAVPGAKAGGERWTGKEISWVRPEGWTQKDGGTRISTLSAGTGDTALEVAVTQFPGEVGGKLQNINRWRAQVGMPPIGEGDLTKESEEIQVGNVKGYLVDFKGADKRLLAAALPHGGNTYFVKAGPAATGAVEKHKAEYRAFVESIRFAQ